MPSIISSALAGMNMAQNKFVKSASLITSAPLADRMYARPEAAPQDQAGVENTAAERNSTAYAASNADIVEEVVSMKVAEHAYAANIKVLQTWDRMTEALLNAANKK